MLVHRLSEGKNILNHSYSDTARFLLWPSAETWNVGVGTTQDPTSAWAHRESRDQPPPFLQEKGDVRGDATYLLSYCKLNHFPCSTKAALSWTDKAHKPLSSYTPSQAWQQHLKATQLSRTDSYSHTINIIYWLKYLEDWVSFPFLFLSVAGGCVKVK